MSCGPRVYLLAGLLVAGACNGPPPPAPAAPDAGAPDTATPPPDLAAAPRDLPAADLPSPDAPSFPDVAPPPPPDTGPGWTPLDLPGLMVWLDASSVVAADGKVAVWRDRSAWGHDFMEPDLALRPAFIASESPPVVRFDGKVTRLGMRPAAQDPSLRRGTGDFVVAVVTRVRAHFSTLWWEENVRVTAYPRGGGSGLYNGQTVFVTSGEDPVDQTEGRLRLQALFRVNGHEIETRINGGRPGRSRPSGSQPFPTVTVLPSPVTLGRYERPDYPQPHMPLDGDIAEVVMAATDRAGLIALEGYLMAKHHLQPSPKLEKGKECMSHPECLTGLCIDGVCCETTCTRPCYSCAVPITRGTCAPIPAGDDYRNHCPYEDPSTCGRDGTCDGAGGCRLFRPHVGCRPAVCAAGARTVHLCSGDGRCLPPVTVACASGVCRAGGTDCVY